MPTILQAIRGLAQPFIRAAVKLKLGFVETYDTLKQAGLGFIESQAAIDFEVYDQQPVLMDEVYKLDSGYMIPTTLHADRPIGMKFAYKYDVTADFWDAKGNVKEVTRSVISGERLSMDEVFADAETWPDDYGGPGYQRATGFELVGAYKRV